MTVSICVVYITLSSSLCQHHLVNITLSTSLCLHHLVWITLSTSFSTVYELSIYLPLCLMDTSPHYVMTLRHNTPVKRSNTILLCTFQTTSLALFPVVGKPSSLSRDFGSGECTLRRRRRHNVYTSCEKRSVSIHSRVTPRSTIYPIRNKVGVSRMNQELR